MRGFTPSLRGTASNLATLEYVERYATGGNGAPVQVGDEGVPAQAGALSVASDRLEISRTGKPGGETSLTMDRLYSAQDFDTSPQGVGVVPEATLARVRGQRVSVKLAARGYIDPAAMAARQGQRGTEVISNDLQFIP